jgi:hypothetical protein
MPDITMCNGIDCHLKENCYRFKAEPSEFMQSYFSDSPIKDDKCDYYWMIDEKYTNKTIENIE